MCGKQPEKLQPCNWQCKPGTCFNCDRARLAWPGYGKDNLKPDTDKKGDSK